MLTSETVSGIRKVLTIVDGAVKAFPQYNHQQIAAKLVEMYGDELARLQADIKSAVDAGKKAPFQKVGSLSRLGKYQQIMQTIADLFMATETTAPVAKPVKVAKRKAPSKLVAPVIAPQVVTESADEWDTVRESFKEAA